MDRWLDDKPLTKYTFIYIEASYSEAVVMFEKHFGLRCDCNFFVDVSETFSAAAWIQLKQRDHEIASAKGEVLILNSKGEIVP